MYMQSYFFKMNLNVIPPSTARTVQVAFPEARAHVSSLMSATSTTLFVCPDLIILFGEGYKLRCSSLTSVLPSYVRILLDTQSLNSYCL